MLRVSSEIGLRRFGAVGCFAGDRPPRRPAAAAFGEFDPRLHLHLVGAFDRVLVVLALGDEAADADHGHRREHGEGDREADPEAVGKRRTQAAAPAGICLRGYGGRGYRPRRRLRRVRRRDRRGGDGGLVRRARARRAGPALPSSASPAAAPTSPTGSPTPAGDELGAAPAAARQRARHRPRHGPRAQGRLGAGATRGAGGAGGRPLRGRGGQRRSLLRDGVRRRAGPARPRRGGGVFPDEARPAGDRRCASSTRWPRSTPSTPTRSGSATSAARRTTSPASCALARPVGAVEDPRGGR